MGWAEKQNPNSKWFQKRNPDLVIKEPVIIPKPQSGWFKKLILKWLTK